MNINDKEKNINNLEEVKSKIKEKEEIILQSQIKQTKIESKIRKLESKKGKIMNEKNCKLRTIFSYITYDVVMISLLMLFVTQFIDILSLSRPLELSLYIIQLYIGVTVISISGAYISSKIDTLLNNYFDKKKLKKITKLIQDKQEELKLEINIQELSKKEITNIISDNIILNESKEEYMDNNYKQQNNHESKEVTNHKIRIKKL